MAGDWAELMAYNEDFSFLSQEDYMPETEKVIGKVKVLNVRCAFPNVIEAQSYDGNPAKYNITLLVPKSDKKQIAEIGDAIKDVVNDKWPISTRFTAANQRPPKDKIAFQDGDEKQWDGYPGNWYIHATANPGYEPKVIDNLRQPITREGVIYGGCYVNAIIKFWGWTNPKGGRGISASIMAVQFAGKGERFGSAPIDVDQEFEAIPLDGLEESDGFGAGEATGQTVKESMANDPYGLPF